MPVFCIKLTPDSVRVVRAHNRAQAIGHVILSANALSTDRLSDLVMAGAVIEDATGEPDTVDEAAPELQYEDEKNPEN